MSLRTVPQFELPLRSGAPPIGFGWKRQGSSTFNIMELDQRDTFLGVRSCVICGDPTVDRCQIIPDSETWKDLKRRGWIPRAIIRSHDYEPRNGMLMCPSHHSDFDQYRFYIHFLPEVQKFILINYSNYRSLEPFHGKAIALDTRDRCVPFATLFIIHEWRVRGYNPFQPVVPSIPAEVTWQDWINSRGVYDEGSGFIRNAADISPDKNNSLYQPPQSQSSPSTNTARPLEPPTNDVVAKILAATRAQPSWRSCESENTNCMCACQCCGTAE